jgi:pimeloyl-ACP methyl ester carboxylesterase
MNERNAAPATLHVADHWPDTDAVPSRTILLLHGSASSHRQWMALLATRQGQERMAAPDLPGYGNSAVVAKLPGHAQDLHAVSKLFRHLAADGPIDLVGHSYGGTLALELAVRYPEQLRSLVLIEPAAFHLLRAIGDEAWCDIALLSQDHIHLVEAGKLEQAADRFMGYWIGAPVWNAMPEARRRPIVAVMPKVAGEWRWMWQMDLDLARYHVLATRTQLIVGSRTTTAARRVVETLSELLPAPDVAQVSGAGHLAPLTHADDVNGIIRRFIQQVSVPKAGSSSLPLAG